MAINIDLKQIDLKNLAQQRKPVQFAVAGVIVIVILVIAYFTVFSSINNKLNTLKQEEQTLKSTFTEKTAQTTNLEDLQKELAQINQSFQTLLKQLPTEAEIPNLIQELHQAAASNNLRMDSITPSQIRSGDSNDGSSNSTQSSEKNKTAKSEVQVIKTLSYDISITGSYQQINNFAHTVGKLSRIVTLNHLNLKNSDKNNMFTLTAVANTYQALSNAEIKAMMTEEAKDKN